MKEFIYENEKYQIDASRIVSNGGDINEINKTVYIDRSIPEKFHEGIAVHEIEERKLLMKGHSYVYSHNEAQKRELEFYEKIYNKEKAPKILEEEEEIILTTCHRRTTPRKSKIISREAEENVLPSTTRPIIEIRTIKEVIFDNKRYIIDNSERLIGTLVDVYEKGNIIYIDRDVPERLLEGLVLSELVTRKNLKKGISLGEANTEGARAEQEYLVEKYGVEEGRELFDDELKFQAWKFVTEKKELKSENGGHKIIYDKGEILPK
jgi:hypothetical protein